MRAVAFSIDLDSPTEYAAIHGVRIDAEDPHLMYRGPLQRFATLCEAVGGKGTIFAIGRDVCGIGAKALRQLSDDGHEIACHSHHHDYHLTRRQPGQILNELRQASVSFRDELNLSPLGFRAPGYHMSSELLDVLEGLGYLYDSSILPSPLYWGAKLAAMTAHRLCARPSGALLGSPRQNLSPTQPYRLGRHAYSRGNRKVVELPVAVATPARLPVTGASLLLAPQLVRNAMIRSLRRQKIVVINLHGIDLLDTEIESLPDSITHRQPELRIPIAERIERLEQIFRDLAQDRDAMTCVDIARRCGV